jgi:hypothetical protein
LRCNRCPEPSGSERLPSGSNPLWQRRGLLPCGGPRIYQIFEGTAQVQRLVISRMQAQQYRDADDAEEKPLGSAVADAVAATAT